MDAPDQTHSSTNDSTHPFIRRRTEPSIHPGNQKL